MNNGFISNKFSWLSTLGLSLPIIWMIDDIYLVTKIIMISCVMVPIIKFIAFFIRRQASYYHDDHHNQNEEI